eukprot:FR735919.1.p1 GENE.FR735919.1~~FR735919.1.p1  ORF type:complete len:296 (+),score=-11.65 FR735919.1:126-890(+)
MARDLPRDDPIIVTLLASEDVDTNFSAWTRYGTCLSDDEAVSFDCPLGEVNYTCDQALGGSDGTYFLEMQCPGVVPSCLSWSSTNEGWSEEGCYVLNYTTTNVACACYHFTDFVLGQNVPAPSLHISYTTAPTSPPSFPPTSLPSPLPTSSPTPPPSFAPTLIPSPAPTLAQPTPAPNPLPTASPSTERQSRAPTASPTTLPSPSSLPNATTKPPHPRPRPMAGPPYPTLGVLIVRTARWCPPSGSRYGGQGKK